jgi:hypothetical protein
MGFLVVMALIWLNELLDLPHHLFGAPPIEGGLRLEEAMMEAGAVLLVGVVVVLVRLRTEKRLAELESLVVLCGWCRRVRTEDGWLSLERLLGEQGARTTHGICEECAAELEAA